MRQNNWEHFYITQSLTNRFDYCEYEDRCANAGIVPKSVLEYAQKAGLLTVAENQYPSLSSKEAYTKIFDEFSEPYGGISTPQPVLPESSTVISAVQSSTGCGSCGGGKVR